MSALTGAASLKFVPKLVERLGFKRRIRFSTAALRLLARGYTVEAGVRELQRQIESVLRKLAVRLTAGQGEVPRTVSAKLVRTLLGPPDIPPYVRRTKDEVGIATGLAWTSVGGDILMVEAARMPGDGTVQVTGSLGDVMKESVAAAITYVRSRADKLGIDAEAFTSFDTHVHFPEGGTPKDGPSAGIAVTTVVASLFTGRPVRAELAMTGEVTLLGAVLPIGGMKEKLAAAARLRIRTVLIPKGNEAELETLRPSVRERLEIIPVSHMDEVLSRALRPTPRRRKRAAKK